MTFVAFITSEAVTFQKTPIVTFGYIMQVIFSLLIVLALLYISSKYLLPLLKTNPKGKLVEIEDRLTLEPGVSAYVLKTKTKRYLITVSQKTSTLIDSFEGEDLI
ncbi:hypothetical protein A2276_02930 [candidate division WOR-1 bacterium RIFOXYA12_FULL_43_27]|uniref:Flagellar protein n=1 Tax=candidate division WOR-1 bacterium RIFOXYC2_FULL_46_14 TaxID=1802587 RepID=A0A1F4U7W6_UNCSA|nr:MAG: hypothetical protein A2276_02930 [candidate division WOR-1 bacterium RIFOXYA12_FULL_43_27]OGC19340.1 MAG: hypothetical protein A2292_01405 [candidate division WOR-1 bacterium RIFOXYB2_FULL_46_45]OGC30329.1 MAG: hypothetical protein A2232_01405 [candidate division WOR-1 bacterium RIFOXYA2_FULL_46_56]OGC40930.1 MAG: hypothetical protein A2438_01405 [candidate division WOR-1 bacterium RIFOXYC2_FULL_46_14]